MNARRLLLSLLLFLVFSPFSFGQNKRISGLYLTEKYGHFTNPNPSLGHRSYFAAMAADMGLADPSSMILEEEIVGKNGYVHYKYQQFLAGLPIVGSTYFLHEKEGQVVKANGHFTPHANAGAAPAIRAEIALKIAQLHMKAREYGPLPSTSLCYIDPAFPKTSEDLRLAYQIDLQSLDPFDKQRYYVDAQRGEIISHFPLLLQEGVPSTAVTKYYGTVNIVTDSTGPQQYVLHDPTRGGGITVWNTDLSNFTNNSPHWDLTNDRMDEVALDAHYCTTRYYDMMLGQFGWNGQDGNGKALKVQVHNNGAGNVNAFWDGEYSNYGDGNCLYGPLTTLEVVGHEFTHGMVDYTSQLVYSRESGAINESLADMFGKALERLADPGNFSWVLSHSFLLSPDAEPFRVMDDPKSVEMPAFYGGEFWDDNADVHTNSSIGNLWFSMLVDGKQGMNEAGQSFNVPALGMDKAIQIVFLTNRNYLTENSDYNDFYQYSQDAAEELYGPGAPEIAAVVEAWKAVGLPANAGGLDFDLGIGSGQSFVYNQLCGINTYIPISVDIYNKGITTYLPSMNGSFTLSAFGLPDYTGAITEAIGPGEVLTIEVDDWFIVDHATFFSLDMQLNLSDDDPDNNYAYEYYEIYEYQSSDLSTYASFDKPKCFSTVQNALVWVVNNSCEALPAGTQLGLSIKNSNGSTLWSENYALTSDLEAFRSVILFREIDLGNISSGQLSFYVDYGPDPDPSNNYNDITLALRETISGDYLNEFNDDYALDNTLFVDSYVPDPIVAYQGAAYFGSTGLTTDSEFFTRCPNYENNFSKSGYYSGVSSTIWACVDFSAIENSVLSFDLKLFRNDPATAEGYLYSSMFQARWEGNETGKAIFAGQPEGQLTHHQIGLPKYFKGELEFKFYTEIGQYGDLQPAYFTTDDVVLLDNLQLETGAVGTSEIEKGNNILVYPNPVGDRLTVRAGLGLTMAELQGLDGKLLKREVLNSNAFEMDLSGVGNGLFFLRLQTATGEWVVRKVVKMK
ncbi:MAG: M4 family metallopeptidase [Lewinellaceae bacterium]|nr:M4 family metallopeptidase [Saprospiraceae bacterium]MCB9336609.1 M4 family metallopeptidase [Lewinellaceae bacterium]